MSLRHLNLIRKLSTARVLRRPALSADYKSKQLWEERFNCDLLGSDSTLIKTINNKIISGVDLNNLEIDIFINIAAPRTQDIAQLQEAVSSLRKFRRTIYANHSLPSTSHALCRLFLDSERLDTLTSILEKRVEFGVFPDPFALNLLFDAALEKENYAMGSRLAALIMLQEEFGQSQLNDNFALYSVAKYIESRTNFSDWSPLDADQDPIFKEFDESQLDLGGESKKEGAETAEEAQDDDDEEEDEVEKEYVRIPFLRNPYFDNHFDLTEPRLVCGKTLSMLGLHHLQSAETNNLGLKCKLAGDILEANWPEAQAEMNKCIQAKVATGPLYTDTLKHYVENLEGLDKKPSDAEKKALMAGLNKLPSGGQCLSEEAEARHEQLRDVERRDIEDMKANIVKWTEAREKVLRAQEEIEERKKLIAEIKAKREELRVREQYLYFYDNLKKSSLTRIEYE